MSSLESFETSSFSILTPKQEDEDRMPPLFGSPQPSRLSGSSVEATYTDTIDERAFFKPLWSPPTNPDGVYGPSPPISDYRHVTGHGELVCLPPNHTSSLAPAIVAPKPIRRGPPPFSSPAATHDVASTYSTSVSYEPHAAVDPTMLLHGHTMAPLTQPVESFPAVAAQHLLPS